MARVNLVKQIKVDGKWVLRSMGHKSLETTMRYLAPAIDVLDKVDLVALPSVTRPQALKKFPARETLRPAGARIRTPDV